MKLFHHLDNPIHFERLTDERIETSIIALLLISLIVEARDRDDSVDMIRYSLLSLNESK